MNRYTFRVTLSLLAETEDQARAMLALLDGRNIEHRATPPEEQPQQADGHRDHAEPPARLTITQGADTASPSRPYWLTYAYKTTAGERTMHFSSALARTMWIAGIEAYATVIAQGED